MKMSRNMAKTAAIAIVLLMISVMLMVMSVKAQLEVQPNGSQPLPSGVTPDVTIKPTAYLSFRPNPVGVNQPVLVNIWLDPGPSVVRYFTNMKVTIIKPNQDTEVKTLDSYFADSTAWFEFVPDQPGTWKLKFEFPGGYFPPGIYKMPNGTAYAGYSETYTRSCYYMPASTDWQELKVVEGLVVQSWPPAPLPTDYWTRPVPFENREWWTILGNYPWTGPGGGPVWEQLYPNTNPYYSDRYSFIPWVQAPESAHIVWKRLGADSGIIGGDFGQIGYSGSPGNPTVIFQGRCYQLVTKVFNGVPQSVLRCYDLRTGEIFWERTGLTSSTAPAYIEYSYGAPAVPGAEASVGITASLITISTTRLLKYNPFTGAVTLNVSIPTFQSFTDSFGVTRGSMYYKNGYAMSVQDLGPTVQPRWRLINWTTFGSATNFAQRVITNITFTRNNFGQHQDWEDGLCFVVREPNALTPDGLNPIATYPYVNVNVDNATGIRHGIRIMAWSLKTGQMLYNITIDNMPYTAAESPYSQPTFVADHGKLAILMRDGAFRVYNAFTGEFLFKTETMDYPWDSPAFGAYAIASAYGLFYRFAYSGVYAFNWTNGKIVWKYEAPAFSAYETPYVNPEGTTVYSFNAGGIIADGKLYVYNTEHTPTQPITRGWGLHCINATTGELIWKIKTPGPAVVADGYLSVSCTDGYQYVFGKGKSATSVSVSQDVVAKGSTIMIKGSVLDMSPAQPGTPCVSKESMTTWMEYLHKQQPIDGIWHNETITGVPVMLTAISEDGSSYIDIGTVVTDGYSGTFGVAWTPPKEGTYKIIASFNGDDSYGSSSATTWITVGPAPPTPETPEIPTPTDYMPMLTGLTIAVVIAIIIGIYSIYDHRRLMRK